MWMINIIFFYMPNHYSSKSYSLFYIDTQIIPHKWDNRFDLHVSQWAVIAEMIYSISVCVMVATTLLKDSIRSMQDLDENETVLPRHHNDQHLCAMYVEKVSFQLFTTDRWSKIGL